MRIEMRAEKSLQISNLQNHYDSDYEAQRSPIWMFVDAKPDASEKEDEGDHCGSFAGSRNGKVKVLSSFVALI